MNSFWMKVTGLALVCASFGAGPDASTSKPVAPATTPVKLTSPLSSGFMYQGQLRHGSSLVTGSVNMAFTLYDAAGTGSPPVGGNIVGPVMDPAPVQVTNGVFTVQLDFGPEAFNGEQRWLQINVNGNVLSPRQPITPTPYALQTRGIFVDSAEHVAINTSTTGESRLEINEGTTLPAIKATAGVGSNSNGAITGIATGTNGNGVVGRSNNGTGAWGVWGDSDHGVGVVGQTMDGMAGKFYGDVIVYGTFPSVEPAFQVLPGAFGAGAARGIYLGDDPTMGGNTGLALDLSDSTNGYATLQAIKSSGSSYGDIILNPIAGNVGIGEPTPLAALHIKAGPKDGIAIHQSSQAWGIRILNDAAPAYEAAMYAGSDGFFYMTDKLSGHTGLARLDSTGSWTVASDVRLKRDIEPQTGVLERAMHLRVVSYYYKNQDMTQSPGKCLGFVAQQVREQFPSLVVGHESDQGYLTLDYARMSAVAIGALQELKRETDREFQALKHRMQDLDRANQEQIHRLQAESAEKDGRIGQLEARLAGLEARERETRQCQQARLEELDARLSRMEKSQGSGASEVLYARSDPSSIPNR